jgi:hypothetical protein
MAPSPFRAEVAGGVAGQRGRALVALPNRESTQAVAGLLTRQGYVADTSDDWEEAARLLDLGVFSLVATARAAGAAGKGESLYQRTNRLNPDARRQIFVLLVGDEFKSGDGTQAFVSLGDLVLNTRDAGTSDTLLRNTLLERQRIYQVYLDARRRHENQD